MGPIKWWCWCGWNLKLCPGMKHKLEKIATLTYSSHGLKWYGYLCKFLGGPWWRCVCTIAGCWCRFDTRRRMWRIGKCKGGQWAVLTGIGNSDRKEFRSRRNAWPYQQLDIRQRMAVQSEAQQTRRVRHTYERGKIRRISKVITLKANINTMPISHTIFLLHKNRFVSSSSFL